MKTKQPKCQKCNGTGIQPLSKAMQKTLNLVLKFDGVTAAVLKKRLGIDAAATSQRLNRLEAMGFLKSIKDGRERVFRGR